VDRNPYAPPKAAVADATANRQMEKPSQVTTAVRLLWSSLGLGILSSALQWEYLASLGSVGFILSVQILSFTVLAWLIWKISVGRNWARITFLVLAIIGLGFLAQIPSVFERSPASAVVGVIQLLLQFAALYLVFADPGRRWFRKSDVAKDVT
jgi:hypothetical protein